jgi:archaeal flagellar protein FlaH
MSRHLDFKIERDELSERLGGGLPRGSLIVIEAPYGAGKSILTQRALFGLLSNHHSACVVSTELTTLGFIEQMRSLDYGIEQQLLSGNLLFLPVYPLVARRSLPHNLLERLREAEEVYEKEVIIIDTFSKLITEQQRAFEENGHAPQEPQASAAMENSSGTVLAPPAPGPMENKTPLGNDQRLAAEIEETLYQIKKRTSAGKTIILTVEPDQLPSHVLQLLRDTSDVHLGLEFSLVGNNASRRIVVKRFSRAKGRLGDVIGYRVEPGVGLVIEIKSVA